MKEQYFYKKGLTLLELIIVFSLVSMFSIGSIYFFSNFSKTNLEKEVIKMNDYLRYIQTIAIARNKNIYLKRINTNTYEIIEENVVLEEISTGNIQIIGFDIIHYTNKGTISEPILAVFSDLKSSKQIKLSIALGTGNITIKR